MPLVCDSSSDFLSRPVPVDKYGILYACAQKNAGPAGVTVVVIRKDLIERGSESLPGYLYYKNHAEADSMWNTPPTFAIYVLGKVAHWLADDIGGLAAMEKLNREKAQLLYDVIDTHAGFYKGHAEADCRSQMNVTFKLSSEELQSKFISEAAAAGFGQLEGAPQRRRDSCQYLQRDAARRCRDACQLHEGFRCEERLMRLKDEAWHLHLRWGRQTPVMLQAGGNLFDPSPALSRLECTPGLRSIVTISRFKT